MKNEIIEFYATDGVMLNGYINKENSNNNKVLIQIHGMTSNCLKRRERVIAQTVKSLKIDSICINTRGSEIVKYIKYQNGNKKIAGTAYEDVEESYYDIVGVINYALKQGYSSIYLQGHSLGATKIVYTYNKLKEKNDPLLKHIKGIILLSLVDIPDLFKTYSKSEYVRYAEEKEKKGEVLDLMPLESFIHPISVQTFLKYVKYNEKIDFAQYNIENNDFSILNQIEVPIFMRWGNINELIKRTAENQTDFMLKKIKNIHKDIGYVDGADHSYTGKESILAEQIKTFLEIN